MSSANSRTTSTSAPVAEVVVGSPETLKCVTRKDKTTLILFKQTNTKTNYWDFIELAAVPVQGRALSAYQSKHAECAWCLKCNVEVDYTVGVITGVLSHLKQKHEGHIEKNQKDSNSKSTVGSGRSLQMSIQDAFAVTLIPHMKKASQAEQKKGEALLLYWIVTSIRPFKIVEDDGFQRFCTFLNGLNSRFRITERTRLSKQVAQLNKAVSISVKHKLIDEMDWFSITTDIWTSRTMESFMAVTIHYLDPDFNMKEFVLEVRQFSESHTGDNIR